MSFNLFGTPTRATPGSTSVVVTTIPTSTSSTMNNKNSSTNIDDMDSHVDTAREMQEIRKALLAQQALEDAVTERLFGQSKVEETSNTILDTSRTMTESSSSSPTTPSPQRRYRYDAYNYWDSNEAEKKDDDDDDESYERKGDDLYDSNEKFQADMNVILYNDGATELFKCIEEGTWERATELLHTHPEQASIWILSTGTMNTTFNWSKWKRLPLHEAARRQPPTDFMTLLIATYPDAVKAVTQFGELPLHLAVECGASPGVVNLLAVSHWRGCHETDQSGRTPMDVLQENDLLLDPIEHKAVVDALSASAFAYKEIVHEHTEEMQQLRDEHDIGLAAIRQQHDEDLVEEQEKQDKLLQQVAALQQQLSTANSVIARQQVELHSYKSNEHTWKVHINELEQERSKWMELYKTEQVTVQELRTDVFNRDQQAVVLADRIVDLQTCIQRLANWHKTAVRKQIHKLKKSYESAHNELLCFTDTLNDHNDDLQTLLVDIGVDELPTKSIQKRRPSHTATTGAAGGDRDDEANMDHGVSVQLSDPSSAVPNANNCEEDAFDEVEDDEALVSRVTQSANHNVVSSNVFY